MEAFSKLVKLLETLRGENGCSWDRKQTVKEFKTYLLEEVYELIDAIDKDDYKALKEEFGDLFFISSLSPRSAGKEAHSI